MSDRRAALAACSMRNATNDRTYTETITSRRTQALFVALTLLFLSLLVWRATSTGLGILAIAFCCLSVLFLFYSLNYRKLVLRLTPEALKLEFGIFTWAIRLDTIGDCHIDDLSLWWIGGAGIHFRFVRGSYRAHLNFLEHPRVVLRLEKRRRLVREVAFSTRRPEEVLRFLREMGVGTGAARNERGPRQRPQLPPSRDCSHRILSPRRYPRPKVPRRK